MTCHRSWYRSWPAPARGIRPEHVGMQTLISAACSLLYYIPSEKWEMQRLKATCRAVHWGFNLITWAGDLCALLSLSSPFMCRGSKLPGIPWGYTSAAPVPQPSSSSWPAFEPQVLEDQHLGCPLELGLRNTVGFGWRTISFLLTVFGSGFSMNSSPNHPPTQMPDARMNLRKDT